MDEAKVMIEELEASILETAEEFESSAVVLAIVMIIVGVVLLIVVTIIAVKLASTIIKVLTELVAEIKAAAERFRQGDLSGSVEIAGAANDLAAGTSERASAVEELTARATELEGLVSRFKLHSGNKLVVTAFAKYGS